MSPSGFSTEEQRTRAWIDNVVVGLNLCPFARPVIAADGLRLTVCKSSALEDIAALYLQELELICESPESEIATSLLVLPAGLEDFDSYLDFVDNANHLLEEQGLAGTIQLASFHPRYQFEGEPEGAASHYTNRSPYPMIHFLREDMVARALADFPNPQDIPRRNIQTLEAMDVIELQQNLDNL
ncbi:MAG: DUF1415 domain-containing protein [Porticoccaceae bacterium]